jgi:exosome complex component RRP4
MDVTTTTVEDTEKRAINAHLVLPGEIVTDDQTAMRGHGTYLLDGKIIASVAGVVERIGKLISVKPLRSRYVLWLMGSALN